MNKARAFECFLIVKRKLILIVVQATIGENVARFEFREISKSDRREFLLQSHLLESKIEHNWLIKFADETLIKYRANFLLRLIYLSFERNHRVKMEKSPTEHRVLRLMGLGSSKINVNPITSWNTV